MLENSNLFGLIKNYNFFLIFFERGVIGVDIWWRVGDNLGYYLESMDRNLELLISGRLFFKSFFIVGLKEVRKN